MFDLGNLRARVAQIADLSENLIGEMDSLCSSNGSSVDSESFEKVDYGLRCLHESLRLLEALLATMPASDDEWRNEYSRYRREYEKLVSSRSVRALFALKRMLGRGYDELLPSSLPMLDFDSRFGAQGDIAALRSRVPRKSERAESFASHWKSLISSIPESHAGDYYHAPSFKVGIITDEYMYNYYKDALDLVYLDPENYKEQFSSYDFAFVLYVSCWTGMNDGDFLGEEGREKAKKIFEYANSVGVVTVFQTIEDPVHFEDFLDIARVSKFVFTSDSNMVEAYKALLGSGNVHVLEYGVNPLFHNPVGFLERASETDDGCPRDVLFAGAWYANYPIRCVDTERIFSGVLNATGHELIIVDRHSEKAPAEKQQNIFPAVFQPYITPAIGHQDLQKVHKLFDYSICLNSVKDSSTMCAMRVYELQALGSSMLSNYSQCILDNFPAIFMISDEREVGNILNGYTDQEVVNMQLAGIRDMFSNCTVYDRLNGLFEIMDINYAFGKRKVAVVVQEETTQKTAQMRYPRQTFKEFSLLREEDIGLSIVVDDFDYLVFADEDFFADRFFLEDAINAFKFTDASYVNFVSDYTSPSAYCFCEGSADKTNTVFSLDRVDVAKISDEAYLSGLRGFSLVHEDWRRCTRDCEKLISVIIPVRRDYDPLRDRCFLSLLRSSIFSSLQIYLMGYECFDVESEELIRYSTRGFDNVALRVSGGGGEWSYADACNEGLRLSREEYVAFVVPDSELINDGLAALLKIAQHAGSNLVVGDMTRVAKPFFEPLTISAYSYAEERVSASDFLKDSGFEVIGIQSCLIRRSVLREDMRWNREASCSDRLFYYEVILEAGCLSYAHLPVCIDYREDRLTPDGGDYVLLFQGLALYEELKSDLFKSHALYGPYADMRLQSDLDEYRETVYRHVELRATRDCLAMIDDVERIHREKRAMMADGFGNDPQSI